MDDAEDRGDGRIDTRTTYPTGGQRGTCSGFARSPPVGTVCDIFGNPFRPVNLDPTWRTITVVALAKLMYDSRDFSAMPILGDALQDACCDDEPVLTHCRGDAPHVRGCWVVDMVLGKE